MAIRVRKLARQLGRDPDDLVELLQIIGLSRYNSPNHMLPAHAEDALREAVRKMPARRRPTPRPAPAPRPSPMKASVMESVVPGVQPLERDSSPVAPRPPVQPRPTEPDAKTKAARARLAQETEALERVREEVSAEREALAAERARLESQRAELTAEIAATRRERSALRERIDALEATRQEDRTFLSFMLHERGLRGMDECERALAALAERRQLRPILELLRCDRPDRVVDVLSQRLVLVGGEVPSGLPETLAAVSVAPDRADVPGERDLSRALARFGEILMLHGLRRLTVVGGRPAWHKTLREGLDPRVDLRFIASAGDIGALVHHDLCVLWGVDAQVEPEPAARGLIVRVDGDHLLSLLTGVEEFLRDSAA